MKRLVILLFIFFMVVGFGTYSAVNKIKYREMQNRFRNFYSVYAGLLQSTVMDMSGETDCNYSTSGEANISGCDNFYRTFVQKMKIKKYCQNNALAQNCVARYEAYPTTPKCYGFFERMINDEDDVFVFEDGSSIIIFNTKDEQRTPFFAVDVNGVNPPNKAGEDLFTMLIMRNAGGSYYFHSNITYCMPVEKGGIENIQDIYK